MAADFQSKVNTTLTQRVGNATTAEFFFGETVSPFRRIAKQSRKEMGGERNNYRAFWGKIRINALRRAILRSLSGRYAFRQ